MVRRLIFVLCFLSILFSAEAKVPELENIDVHEMIAQMVKSHVTYDRLDDLLIHRSLKNYISQLDPMKTYFIKEEVDCWLDPSEEMIENVIDDYAERKFTVFIDIHNTMINAIKRRERLNALIEIDDLPPPLSSDTFQDMEWAASEDELFQRLQDITAFLMKASEVFSDEKKQKFLERQQKQRINYHEGIICENVEERHSLVLTNVLKALSSAMDIHTMYFTPAEATQFMVDVQRRLFGVGVQLRDNLNGFSIVKIIDNSPASKSKKLKVNDRVVAVDDDPVIGLSIEEVVEVMRGEKGDPIELTIVREVDDTAEETFTLSLVRDEVIIKDSRIESSIEPYGDGVIAIVTLHTFYQDPQYSSAEDLIREIEKIKSEHAVKAIVLDVRYNTGGLLSQAIAVTGLFISQGVVASVKDNNGDVYHIRDFGHHVIWEGPLVVLTSRMSASAPEIVAQALQDYGRAIVIGDDHTFGKGTFQTFTLDTTKSGDVNPKGEFKVTRGIYYTVSGKSPQRKGVIPDIVVPGIFSQEEIGECYEEMALVGDSLPDSFIDDMSDIVPEQREKLWEIYGFDLQKRLSTFTRHLGILKRNSSQRLDTYEPYQNFLERLTADDPDDYTPFNAGDLQLLETLNIAKDLIYLHDNS